MTDAVAAAAQIPADTNVAPIQAEAAPPAPLSETPPAPPEAPIEPVKHVSTREALRLAREKVEAGEAAKAAAAGDAKDPNKGADLARDPGGKFTPKDAKPAADGKPAEPVKPAAAAAEAAPAAKPPAAAPATRTFTAPERFSNDAKAVWDTAPEPVRAEVDRMHREMTAGIEKHRVGAEKFDRIRSFDEMATKGGTDLHTALTRYTNLEGLLRSNPMKGLEEVCSNIGVSLRQVAEIVLGQAPDQERAQSDQTNRELRQKIERLEQQVGGVVDNTRRQAESSLEHHITSWVGDWPHFEVFAPHIAQEMQAGATDLDAAYEAVLQKHPSLAALARKAAAAAPAADAVKPAASAAAPDLTAQTDKGSKSIKGAPGPGSEPAARPRSNSIREALKRAAARAG